MLPLISVDDQLSKATDDFGINGATKVASLKCFFGHSLGLWFVGFISELSGYGSTIKWAKPKSHRCPKVNDQSISEHLVSENNNQF